MKNFAIAATALLSFVSLADSNEVQNFVKGLLKNDVKKRRLLSSESSSSSSSQRHHRPVFINQHRRFGNTRIIEPRITQQEDGDTEIKNDDVFPDDDDFDSTVLAGADPQQQQQCDASFLGCLPNDKCVMCFVALQTEGIDWASVPAETPCSDVTKFLFDGNHCKQLQGDQAAIDVFCNTFDSCVIWEDDGKGPDGKKDNSTTLDCNSLTECQWDGMHELWVGDGVCHNDVGGCYNHKICNYDGGDCCSDTCVEPESDYKKCGDEGFTCKDPNSAECDSSPECPKKKDDDDKPKVECGADETMYRIVMYDSFGDGWDATKLTLSPKDDANKIVFQGGLEDGSEGTQYICLATSATCYHATVDGGLWGNEISWEVKPSPKGSPAVASGSSPMDCEFSVGGEVCLRSCDGKANKDVNNDPEYRSYKEMYNCMSTKCIIQLGGCSNDDTCKPCLNQDAPEYCFTNELFKALVDCSICNCSDEEEQELSEFCENKAAPGAIEPPFEDDIVFEDDAFVAPCSPAETLKGTGSVIKFSKCADMDQLGAMVTDFDENNFGALDTFESCAHSYKDENLHGGHTALGCMQILANAINQPNGDRGDTSKDTPVEAIKALAEHIYHNGETFCECAKQANEDCPLCPSFENFKTLLFETLDACTSLDWIDCDAWSEFYAPCKTNVQREFTTVNFNDKAQCTYVAEGCGGAGPFPAFRKLDCGREITKTAWDFYNQYDKGCLGGDGGGGGGGTNPVPPPPPPPPPPVTPSTPKPAPVTPSTPKPYTPYTPSSPSDDGKKPYVPPPDDNDDDSNKKKKPYKPSGSSDDDGKKKKKGRGWFWFFVLLALGGGAYYYHKRNSGSFDFVRYRRARNYAPDEDMYSSLSMEGGSSSFQPPSLPPTPMAMT